MKRLLSIFILAALFVAVCGVQAYVPVSTQYDSQLDSAVTLCVNQAGQINFDTGYVSTPTLHQWSSGHLFTGSFQRGFCFPKSHVPPDLSVRIICLNNPVNRIDPTGLSTVRIDVDSDGGTQTITLVDPTIKEFREALNAQADGSITNLEISGHGSSSHITIEPGGSGHGLAFGNQEKGVVFTDTGDNFAEVFGGKLADGATIDLIGCNTGNTKTWFYGRENPIARQLSSELPRTSVIGSRGFGLGNEVGLFWNRDKYVRVGKENHAFRMTRTYRDGEEQ